MYVKSSVLSYLYIKLVFDFWRLEVQWTIFDLDMRMSLKVEPYSNGM
jgi:hypothetical protein